MYIVHTRINVLLFSFRLDVPTFFDNKDNVWYSVVREQEPTEPVPEPTEAPTSNNGDQVMVMLNGK